MKFLLYLPQMFFSILSLLTSQPFYVVLLQLFSAILLAIYIQFFNTFLSTFLCYFSLPFSAASKSFFFSTLPRCSSLSFSVLLFYLSLMSSPFSLFKLRTSSLLFHTPFLSPSLHCSSFLPVSAVFLLFVGESCVAGQCLPLLPAAVEEEGETGIPQEQRHVCARIPPLNSFPLEKTAK
jgi:hypothetical protein